MSDTRPDRGSYRFRKRVLVAAGVALFVLVWVRELLRLPQGVALLAGVAIVLIALAVLVAERRRARREVWKRLGVAPVALRPRRWGMAATLVAGSCLPLLVSRALDKFVFGTPLGYRFSTYTGATPAEINMAITWGPVLLGALLILGWPRGAQCRPSVSRRVRVRRKRV